MKPGPHVEGRPGRALLHVHEGLGGKGQRVAGEEGAGLVEDCPVLVFHRVCVLSSGTQVKPHGFQIFGEHKKRAISVTVRTIGGGFIFRKAGRAARRSREGSLVRGAGGTCSIVFISTVGTRYAEIVLGDPSRRAIMFSERDAMHVATNSQLRQLNKTRAKSLGVHPGQIKFGTLSKSDSLRVPQLQIYFLGFRKRNRGGYVSFRSEHVLQNSVHVKFYHSVASGAGVFELISDGDGKEGDGKLEGGRDADVVASGHLELEEGVGLPDMEAGIRDGVPPAPSLVRASRAGTISRKDVRPRGATRDFPGEKISARIVNDGTRVGTLTLAASGV